MTRPLNQGQGKLLRLLARMPFLDRLELAALAGRSRGGAYEAAARLEHAGLVASVSHGTPLLAPTRRYYLTEKGVHTLAVEEVRPVDRLLREYPLSPLPADAAGTAGRRRRHLSPGLRPQRPGPPRPLPLAPGPAPGRRRLTPRRARAGDSEAGSHRRAHRFRQAPLAAGSGSPARRLPGDCPRRGAPAPGRNHAAPGPPCGVISPGLLRVGTPRCVGQRQPTQYGGPLRAEPPSPWPRPWAAPTPAAWWRWSRPWCGFLYPGTSTLATSTRPMRAKASPITCCPSCCAPPKSAPWTCWPTGPGSPGMTWPGSWT